MRKTKQKAKKRALLWTLFAVLLLAAGLFALSALADQTQEPTIRVGLVYEDAELLASAVLENELGSGFEFGTYSSDGTFTAQAKTEKTKITIMKDPNSQYGLKVCAGGTSNVLFRLSQGEGTILGIRPVSTAGEKTTTWFQSCLYYGGFSFQRRSGGDMTVVNLVPQEDYVACVLVREMYVTWPSEALKAGACAARSCAQAVTRYKSMGFDVSCGDDCQVYQGVFTDGDMTPAIQAAQATAGEVILYDGKPIEALYCSSDGGATEDAVNAWGSDIPYLKGKYDPFDTQTNNPNTYNTYYYTTADLTAALRKKDPTCAAVVDVKVTAYTDTGNVQTVVFTDANGKTYSFSKDAVRLFGDSANGRFLSRRYTIIAPHTTGSFSKITSAAAEVTTTETLTPITGLGTASGTQGGYYVYDGSSTLCTNTIAVLTASGLTIRTWDGEAETQQTVTTTPLGYPEAVVEEISVTNDTDDYMIVGSGWGHNVGMSQYGAKAMAELGYTYDQILKFYYTGVTIQ